MDAGDAVAPGEVQRLGQEPTPVPLTGELRDQADEGDLALAVGPKIQFQQANFAGVIIDDRKKFDLGMMDDGLELGIVHDQSGEP